MRQPVRRNLLRELAAKLDAELAPLGFVLDRRAARFRLQLNSGCVVVDLQSSSKSTGGTAVVAANAGIWNPTLAAKLGGPGEAESAGAMDCHWWLRAGQLGDGQGRWWTFTADDVAAVAAGIWALLAPVVALLVPLKGDAELLSYLRREQPPFLDPMNRWAFVAVLADAVGDRDALLQASSELQRVGQTRTLPVGHKMLLREIEGRGIRG